MLSDTEIDHYDAMWSAQLDRDASCHYGDHIFARNGYCTNCYEFSGGWLQYQRFEKAEREGTLIWHGDPELTPDDAGYREDTHVHYSPKAAAQCRHA